MGYAKDEILAEAIRILLIADTTPTGADVREVMYYVNSISEIRYSNDLAADFGSYPALSIKTERSGDNNNLPTGFYLVHIMGSIEVNTTQSRPQEKLKRLMSRVDALVNKKTNDLNNAVSSKNLRCRLFINSGSQEYEDFIKKIHRILITYKVQCDDETLN
jgi:hypothetical protein